ncbi:MAG: hypothetical protein IT160_02890 [Bryobacterales bacterium]|nr:hypothetical protein [Bryobacterales bacterium]
MKLLPLLAAVVLAPMLGAQPDGPQTLLDEGYRQMYNLQFGEAHRTFAKWQQMHPEDPMGPVSDAAAYLYSEFDRLKILQSEFFASNDGFFGMGKRLPDPGIKWHFEQALAKAGQLAKAILDRSPKDPNARFAEVLRTGLYSDYLAMVEKRYMAALTQVKESRAAAESLLAEHPDYYDAYLAVGVENYILSLKPAPVRWFLRLSGAQTDRALGVEKLRLTAEHGRYLMPYARLLLAVAALRDNNKGKARQTLAWLAAEFPRNHLYREELAKLN